MTEIDEYTCPEGLKVKAKINFKIKIPPKILNFYINRL